MVIWLPWVLTHLTCFYSSVKNSIYLTFTTLEIWFSRLSQGYATTHTRIIEERSKLWRQKNRWCLRVVKKRLQSKRSYRRGDGRLTTEGWIWTRRTIINILSWWTSEKSPTGWKFNSCTLILAISYKWPRRCLKSIDHVKKLNLWSFLQHRGSNSTFCLGTSIEPMVSQLFTMTMFFSTIPSSTFTSMYLKVRSTRLTNWSASCSLLSIGRSRQNED